jgi:uncharacterized protein (TIGR01777 family)
MKILLTGASGFIGRKLARRLFQSGHDLVVLGRDVSRLHWKIGVPCQAIACDLTKGPPPKEAFVDVDAVVHLAGESVASGRWTSARKKKITESRVLGTRHLVEGMNLAGINGPKIFVAASAIGIYGNRGEELLAEDSGIGRGFLAEVCRDWESEIQKANSAERRVAILRLGVVLGEGEGALAQMLKPFGFGLGAVLGTGNQWMSWVHIDDVIDGFCFALDNSLNGPFNLVAPEPVVNSELTLVLGEILKTKPRFHLPQVLLNVALGEMAGILLDSARVSSARLKSFGFSFKYSTLHEALKQICANYPDSIFETQLYIERPVAEVFEFFSDAKNLEKITPPWLNFFVIQQSTENLGTGSEIDYKLRLHGVPFKWRSRLEDWQKDKSFVDTQIKGPYSKWHHLHEFTSLREGTLIKDLVTYRLHFAQLGSLVAGSYVKHELQEIFSYRSSQVQAHFK